MMNSELMRLLKNENYRSRGVLNSDMKIDQESAGWLGCRNNAGNAFGIMTDFPIFLAF